MNQAQSIPVKPLEALPLPSARSAAWSNIQALGGVVVKELCRRKDLYVLFVLTAVLTLALSSASFFGETEAARYVKEVCLLLIWVAALVIGVTLASRQIPAEKELRTLYPLLAKPVTRTQVVLGKFAGCWAASGLSLLAFYLFFVVVTGLQEGQWPLLRYVQALTLHWMFLGVVTALAMLGSVVLAAPSSTNTIVLVAVGGILLVARHLNTVALGLEEPLQSLLYALYFAIPHLEIFDVRDLLIHGWEAIPWLAWLGALIYGAVYAAVFLFLACLIFRRQELH